MGCLICVESAGSRGRDYADDDLLCDDGRYDGLQCAVKWRMEC